MLSSQYFDGNRYFCVLLSLFVTWRLACAKDVQHSLHSSTYCNQVLGESEFILVHDEEIKKVDQQLQLYEFAYPNKVLHESCVLAGSHGLRIRFERVAKVSYILIHQTAFNAKLDEAAVKISIWSGTTVTECKLSGNFTELPNGKFASFTCLKNDAPNSVEPAANALEITNLANQSVIKVNLTNLKVEGSFDWLYLVQRTTDQSSEQCLPPGLYTGQKLNPEKKSYFPGENVTFVCPDDSVVEPWDAQRTCQKHGHWSDSTPKCQPKSMANRNGITKQCPPITPYFGMPEKYKSYELILDGSINELLLTSPCREGFRFVGNNKSEISQCKDGSWQGLALPICEIIEVKSPTEVEHASWIYIQDDGQHKTVYICENGYYVTGKGNTATYSIEDDEWFDVPECQRDVQDWMREYWYIILLSVLGLLAAPVTVYFICRWIRIRLLNRNNTRQTSVHGDENSNGPLLHKENELGNNVLPSKTKSPELANSSNDIRPRNEVVPEA